MPRFRISIAETIVRAAVIVADDAEQAAEIGQKIHDNDYDHFKDTCEYSSSITDIDAIGDDVQTFLPEYDKEEIEEILNIKL